MTESLSKQARLGLAMLGLVVFVGGWEAAVRCGFLPVSMVPAPSSLGDAWLDEVRGGFWQQAVWDSLQHYSLGLLIGSILGCALGVVCGMLVVVDSLLEGVVRLLRPVPGLAWVPFAILWFGLNTAGATFIIAISVFWINFYAAYGAVKGVDPELFELAAAFGHGSFLGRLGKIVLPASAPGIMAGLRTGLGQGWMSVVAAELFGVPGIGARMMQASSLLATDVVVVYMLTMALLYAVTDFLFGFVRARVLRWQP